MFLCEIYLNLMKAEKYLNRSFELIKNLMPDLTLQTNFMIFKFYRFIASKFQCFNVQFENAFHATFH